MARLRHLLLLCALTGCAAAHEEAPAAAPPRETAPAEEAAAPPPAAAPTGRPRSRVLFREKLTEARTLTQPEPPTPAGVGVRKRVDVRFRDAPLSEVARFLADAGRFSVVAEGNLSGRVTVDLRQVRPYEALLTIAQAQGAQVTREGSVVIVRGP